MFEEIYMNWELVRNTIDGWVREVGEANVLKYVHEAGVKVQVIEETMKLPEGFEFFRDHDWMAFSGCSRFVDGVSPITGRLPVLVDLAIATDVEEGDEKLNVGDTYMAGVIVAPTDENSGDKTSITFYVGANGCYATEYASRRIALASITAFQLSGKPLSMDLLEALGYVQQN